MTASDRSPQQPASRRIADALRASIERGELEAGQKLPSERALAEQY
ncbi:GntR family transcriptional regulator, partial [Streptomyces sp. NPDC057362]